MKQKDNDNNDNDNKDDDEHFFTLELYKFHNDETNKDILYGGDGGGDETPDTFMKLNDYFSTRSFVDGDLDVMDEHRRVSMKFDTNMLEISHTLCKVSFITSQIVLENKFCYANHYYTSEL